MFFFKKIPSITTKELEEMLPKKPMIIDVREPQEFSGGHIPTAKNIPLKKINSYQTKEPVYIICQSGMRSKQAVKTLRAKGMDAVNVKGGMMSWAGKVRGGKL